ncbi:MAG TPA: peptide-methionine (R)-S-oxide reductase MsrB [Chthoniobacterales bacterium]|nr:peptide-methionine (R)-S-oxide reductase MsrB [Chthoniobacterales bacterium]
MNSSRITSDDTSRVSLGIGLGVAVLLLGVAIYFALIGHAASKKITGFDPNRPVPSDAILRSRLNADQYRVTRENGTETAFQNKYWNNVQPGIYVDVISGEPLFCSVDKFDGGTGRPTFSKPISKDLIVEKDDNSHDMHRIELRAKRSDAHLGHLVADSTSPTGQRYAVNSAALRFIPTEEMQHEGYTTYLSLVTPVTQK